MGNHLIIFSYLLSLYDDDGNAAPVFLSFLLDPQ